MRLVILTAAVAALASGCATTKVPEIQGVTISPEERQSCAAKGCTVWTEEELQRLARHFFMQGIQQGRQRNL